MDPTPTVRSDRLSEHLGKPVYLKLDALCPSGSFKDRAMYSLMTTLYKEGKRVFVSSSGGNAGLAAAYRGKQLAGATTEVVVPTTTKPMMIDKIRALGARVTVHGENWNAADELARSKAASDPTYAYVPPFEHPLIWEGNAAIVDELKAQLPAKPGCVVLSVGGGGLLNGVLIGLRRNGWADVPVVAVETAGAESFHATWEAKRLVTLPAITSIATTLGARCVSPSSLRLALDHPGGVTSVVVPDGDAVGALVRFAEDHRLLVEPSCGCGLSVVYNRRPEIARYDSVAVVVCGGSGVSLDLVQQWRKDYPIAEPPRRSSL